MLFPFAFSISQYILGPLLFLLSLFIILIVLLQRGRGGGLAGALGGAGGSSALGVKAGDIFTRITAVAVLIWIVLCAFVCWYYLEPPPDIAVDPSGDGPALTIGPKDGASPANVPPTTEGAGSEVVSPAQQVLPVPSDAGSTPAAEKPVEANSTETPPAAAPETPKAPDAAGLPPVADPGTSGGTNPAEASTSGDGK